MPDGNRRQAACQSGTVQPRAVGGCESPPLSWDCLVYCPQQPGCLHPILAGKDLKLPLHKQTCPQPSAGMLPPPSYRSSGCRIYTLYSTHTCHSSSLRDLDASIKPLWAPIFLQLTNGPSAPQGCQLLYTPSLQPPDTPDSCRKSSSVTQIPAPPMPKEPLFLIHCSLVPIQMAASSGSHSWLMREAAEVASLGESASQTLFLGSLLVFELPTWKESHFLF